MTEDTIEFLIQGSAEERYRITFMRRSETNLSAYCTCVAGQDGQHCEHRLDILRGDVSSVVEATGDVDVVLDWLLGSDIEGALYRVGVAEKELATAKSGGASDDSPIGLRDETKVEVMNSILALVQPKDDNPVTIDGRTGKIEETDNALKD